MATEHRPRVSEDDEVAAVFEWWCGNRKLTLYLRPEYLLKSWGPNIESDMEEFTSPSPWEIRNAFDWLYEYD